MTPEMKKEFFDDNYYALLAAYVTGTLSDAENMVVASHLTLKPEARQITRKMEAIGGALIQNDIVPEKLSNNCLSDVLSRLDTPYQEAADIDASKHRNELQNNFDFPVPRPILRYLESQTTERAWKNVIRGIEKYEFDVTDKQKSELLRIAPGVGVPAHTHEGEEITLLLHGAFEDETGHYKAGDMIVLDERSEHHPVSDAQTGCICLSVSSAPIKMTGPLMRFLNPFLK